MHKPEFLIIGAAKSGTTSLYYYLKQHEQIFMSSVKEPNYFALIDNLIYRNGTVGKGYEQGFCFTKEEYLKLFENAKPNQLCGEASPIYLYNENTALNIYNYNPNMKLIAILRNPVERAFSNFKYHLKADLEKTKNFEKALDLEENRKREKWWWGYYYFEAGLYYKQLKRYYDIFPHENIKVVLFDGFTKSPKIKLNEIFNFLGVAPRLEIQNKEKMNKSYYPRFLLLEKIRRLGIYKKYLSNKLPESVKCFIRSYNKTEKELNGVLSLKLLNLYKEDIIRLQELIQYDLSCWLRRE
ncbi:MAG: sulfotransferase domain-containing protein [Ignavibacteriae bacterium]|nr:sulfotransferase domain-containing protein [Ignavibacteriota bacterium]